MKVWRSRVGGADTATAPRRGSKFIGVDVGGTKILGVVTDGVGPTESDRELHPTPKENPDDLAPAILAVVRALVERTPEAVGIGVGVPGLVDHAGVLHYGPNVQGVLGLDIAGHLNRAFELPAVAENDGYLTALTEHRLGAARGHDHAIVVTQGTGIGGGLIVGGQVLRGANGFAGEPGHMLVDRFGHRCACGQDGCWESVSSGAGPGQPGPGCRRGGPGPGHPRAGRRRPGGDPGRARGGGLRRGRSRGRRDHGAVRVLDRPGHRQPDRPARPVGRRARGRSVGHQRDFLDGVAAQVGRCVVGGPYRPVVPIVQADFGAEAGAIGAALRARDFVING